MRDYRWGIYWCMDLLTTCIHHLELQAVDSAVANLHTLQFTITHTLVFSVFAGNVLVTDLTQWRFFSFCGHAVACWLTLHT
jgi:hypothetical protein